MANAEMKIFEAEKLHQLMIVAVSMIPIMPLERTKNKQKVRLTTNNWCYLRTVLQKYDKTLCFKILDCILI